jgi:hypothetical protein
VTTEWTEHTRRTALGIYAAVDDPDEYLEWVNGLLGIVDWPQTDILPMPCPAGTFREQS